MPSGVEMLRIISNDWRVGTTGAADKRHLYEWCPLIRWAARWRGRAGPLGSIGHPRPGRHPRTFQSLISYKKGFYDYCVTGHHVQASPSIRVTRAPSNSCSIYIIARGRTKKQAPKKVLGQLTEAGKDCRIFNRTSRKNDVNRLDSKLAKSDQLYPDSGRLSYNQSPLRSISKTVYPLTVRCDHRRCSRRMPGRRLTKSRMS